MFTIIAAVNEKGVIGLENQMPWHVPEDLKHFRNTTLGKVLVMGRKTYDSLPKKLDQRQIKIVSKTLDGHNVIHDFEKFLKQYENSPDKIFIAGGSEIYKQSLPYVSEMILSRIPNQLDGDRFFPDFSKDDFYKYKVTEYETFSVEYYRRKEG